MIGENVMAFEASTSLASVLIPLIGNIIGTAITVLVICLVATPFIKKLIDYAIDKYRQEK